MQDYPGLGLPLRHINQRDYGFYPIGTHGSNYASDSDLIFVHELAMMNVMKKLSDKLDWHKKVFNNEIVEKWRKEALAIPDEELYKLAISGKYQQWNRNDGQLEIQDNEYTSVKIPEGIMSDSAFDCCIEELRSKAKYFDKTGLIPTLDACASVAKSDSLVTPELQEALRTAFDKLQADQRVSPDWHPNSKDMVQDLVHPSMYPLVYGRTRLFKEECVGVADAIELWAGTGTVIPQDDWEYDPRRDRYMYGVGDDISPNYWSQTYQWLPANVAFQEDGSVRFTSYTNNLHQNKYPEIYKTIEKLVETLLAMWDQCLAIATGYDAKKGAGRLDTRIGTGRPDSLDDHNSGNWISDDAEACANAVTENSLKREDTERLAVT